MNTIKFKYFWTILVIFIFVNMKIEAQVGIGTTSPDASSMLEITSTSKGVLIPRMTSVQRTAISSPATGLLVFDTTTQSFWFYTSSWEELNSNDTLVDVDNDTKVEVEKNTDEDIIRFTTVGSERMKIDEVGNTTIGDGINNTYIEADGSLSYQGTATRWDDIKIPVTSTKKEGTKPPSYDIFKDNGSGSQGVISYKFDPDSEEELYFTVQLPHAWKEGSSIEPHVHWSAKIDVGSSSVVWGLEYTWINIGDVFNNTTILTGGTPHSSVGTVSAYEHAVTEIGIINGTGKLLSSMLLCRIYRDATNPSDNFNDDAYLFEIDFHYEIDSDGSHQEYVK